MGPFCTVFATFHESNSFKVKIEKFPAVFMLRKKSQVYHLRVFSCNIQGWACSKSCILGGAEL